MQIKVGTFNLENLFLRYNFLAFERGAIKPKHIDFDSAVKDGKININMLGWSIDDYGAVPTQSRKLIAKAILENKPDVLAVQEVENLEALIYYNRHFLDNYYPYMMVIDGNDPRQIDIGILSRFDFKSIRTHRFEPEGSPPNKRTFSRDCLELEFELPHKKQLAVLVNHFKSQLGGGEERRRIQATRVADILKERFGASLGGNFIVAGDFNDNYDSPELKPLLGLKGLVNVVKERLPKQEQWTHYYKKTKEAQQLDYLLLSPALAKTNANSIPYIERRGLSSDANIYTGERFGEGKGGASDHCPVFITFTL